MPSIARANWLVPIGLIMLSAVPVVVSAVRIAELSGAGSVTTDDERFFAMPVPVVVHVISGSLFCVVGAFQFAPRLRRPRRWHRAAGCALVPLGLATGVSALWMIGVYPLPAGDGDLLTSFRILFGSAMVVSIALGVVALRRRDFARHGAWMTRGYAIGLGAGTQTVAMMIWLLTVGETDVFARAMLHGVGWVINLAVAEWVIRRRQWQRSRPRRAPAPALARSI
jgi:uncharacterized membrane protein